MILLLCSAIGPSISETRAQSVLSEGLVESIIDANGIIGLPDDTNAVPENYARIYGVVATYPYSDGKRYMMEGIRVELWEPGGSAPIKMVYTVHNSPATDDILSPRNYVQDGVWTGANNSGMFDFGNIFVGSSKEFFLRVVYIFYDGANGISESGTYKLSIVDTSKARKPLIFVEYPTATFHSGQDGCPGLCAYNIPELGSDGPQDEAGHAYYDLVKTYTYFQQAASYSISLKTVELNVESPGTIGGGYDGIILSYWPEAPGYLTFEKSGNIIHEYGHTIQADMQGYDFPSLQGYPVHNSFHRGCTNMDSEDALREGWANFVAIVVLDDPVFYWEDYDSGMDLRPGQHPRNAQCDRDGATVASILWNMRENMGPDRHENFRKIAQTLATNNPIYVRTFFDDYIRDWGQAEQIQRIFREHNVDYNLTEHPVNILIGSAQGGESFRPKTIQINVGHTVIWNNTDSLLHSVVSGSASNPDGRFGLDSGGEPIIIFPKGTFQFTFDQAGSYPYFCQLHPAMTGTVEVTQQIEYEDLSILEFAARSDRSTYMIGDTVLVNGETVRFDESSYITLVVTNPEGTVVKVDQFRHDSDGKFDYSLVLAGADAIPGQWSMLFSYGYSSAMVRFSVQAPVSSGLPVHIDDATLTDIAGSPMTTAEMGTPALISTSITNFDSSQKQLVVIVQIERSDRITEQLSWQTASVDAGQTYDAGFAWTPNMSGGYHIKVFVWQSISDPIPLADPRTMTVS